MHSCSRFAFHRLVAAATFLLFAVTAGAQSDYRPPLWQITAGNTTAYLFGTIHVGNADFYPLPASVDSAFRDSDLLVLEVDPADAQDATNAVMSAMYMPPDSIENHVSPALLSRIGDISAAYGMPFQQIRQMKPYMLMFTLTALEYARLGYNAANGIENHLSQRARGSGKQIVALESMAQQMQMLDNLSPQLQAAMLEITLDEIAADEVTGMVGDMIAAWRSGNNRQLNDILTVEERRLPEPLADEFRQRFLSERNVAMADRIERMLLAGQRIFVAVGALHMVGENGIPALLTAKGYKVRQL